MHKRFEQIRITIGREWIVKNRSIQRAKRAPGTPYLHPTLLDGQ